MNLPTVIMWVFFFFLHRVGLIKVITMVIKIIEKSVTHFYSQKHNVKALGDKKTHTVIYCTLNAYGLKNGFTVFFRLKELRSSVRT